MHFSITQHQKQAILTKNPDFFYWLLVNNSVFLVDHWSTFKRGSTLLYTNGQQKQNLLIFNVTTSQQFKDISRP